MTKKITFRKTLHICHRCLTYKTTNTTDLRRHYGKKNPCVDHNNLSQKDALILSEEKRYVFLFDYTKLIVPDYKYIVTNYCHSINYIYEDFRNIKKSGEEAKDEIQEESNEEKSEEESSEEETKEGEEVKKKKKYKVKRRKQLKISTHEMSTFKNNEGRYECPNCKITYKSKQNLEIHFANMSGCHKRNESQKILSYYKNKHDGNIKEVSTQTDPIAESGAEVKDMCIGADPDPLYTKEAPSLCTLDIYAYMKRNGFDYNTSNYEDVSQYVYMIQKAGNINSNIVKIGMSEQNTPERILKYEKGFKILCVKAVKSGRATEKKLLQYFCQMFIQRNDLGKEVFEGNIKDMELSFFFVSCKE